MEKKLLAILFGFALACLLILGYGVSSLGVLRESEDLRSTNASLGEAEIKSELSGWLHRKAHNISGSTAGAQTNYSMMFNVHYSSGMDSESEAYLEGKCRIDFGDIRFTNSTGHELDYWMQSKVDGVKATFWVEIDYIPPSPDYTTIYLHYGNSNATTASNGFNTFLVFDDFEDGTWTDRWETIINNGIVTESGGVLTVETEDGDRYNDITLRSKSNFTGQTVELISLLEHTQHWDRGGYLYIAIAKDSDNFLNSYPLDADFNQIRAGEKYQGSYAYSRITGVILTKNHLHQLTFRGTDTECYVDYYDTESSAHHTITHTYSRNFVWDSQTVYDIRLVNHNWGDGIGGDGNQTDKYYWLAVRKYVSPEPAHGSWEVLPQPPTTYDSGWINITDKAGQSLIVAHNLNSADIIVDLTGKAALNDGAHQKNLGGDDYTPPGSWQYGLVWTNSTADTITLFRGIVDPDWNYVRVRIWIFKENP